jgi:LytS/YehU family sensor histidine kinase
VQSEKVLQVAQAEKFQLSNEKLKTEYDYLKSQINPHFLYNTLGYFYSKMLRLDKPSAEGLATLSDLMRYSLDTGDAVGKVFLSEEVQQVKNYIALQQLRFHHALHIRFSHNEIPETIKIIPHALITIVENAFKYGIASEAEFPIQIDLNVENNTIRFEVTNHVSHQSKDRSSTGIGLKNLVQRLALEYPGKHSYRVDSNDKIYATYVKIEEGQEPQP